MATETAQAVIANHHASFRGAGQSLIWETALQGLGVWLLIPGIVAGVGLRREDRLESADGGATWNTGGSERLGLIPTANPCGHAFGGRLQLPESSSNNAGHVPPDLRKGRGNFFRRTGCLWNEAVADLPLRPFKEPGKE